MTAALAAAAGGRGVSDRRPAGTASAGLRDTWPGLRLPRQREIQSQPASQIPDLVVTAAVMALLNGTSRWIALTRRTPTVRSAAASSLPTSRPW